MTINPSLILLFALTFALPVQAEIYKWTDADGKSHFSGSKPAHPASIENRNDLEVKSPQPTPVDNKAACKLKQQRRKSIFTSPAGVLIAKKPWPFCARTILPLIATILSKTLMPQRAKKRLIRVIAESRWQSLMAPPSVALAKAHINKLSKIIHE